MLKKVFQHFWENKLLVILILLGTISWSLTMVKSGWVYSYGMGFWGANGHDGVWHIALAENLSRGLFTMPVFAGEALKNYHIGFDLILAALYKVTFIPIINLYFQILPPIFALLVGYLTYKFSFIWTRSKVASLWSTFFVYFGGSLGWILGKGESTFWAQESISTLINPPFALSLILILLGLISLIKNKKILSILFFGVLIFIKAYAGLLVLGGLLIAGIWQAVKNKKFNLLIVFSESLILSLLLFLPFNKNSQGLIVFQPFWFLETMMGEGRIDWPRFYSAMTTYRMGKIWIKAISAYLIAFVIFWVGNMGTRIIKEFLVIKWTKDLKRVTWVEVFISSIIIAGGIIPMLFLQKGTSWNTIQFFYYSLFFSGILAGAALSKIKGRTITVLIILLTIPTTLLTLKEVYIPSRPPAKLSFEELEGFKFLSNQPDGMVLTYPFDRNKAREAESSPPRPLYLYESTAYVSAFSKQQVFLEDEINLDITGYDWQTRRREVEAFYNEKDQEKANEFLKKNNIKYIYLIKGQKSLVDEKQFQRLFENKEVEVFMVKS